MGIVIVNPAPSPVVTPLNPLHRAFASDVKMIKEKARVGVAPATSTAHITLKNYLVDEYYDNFTNFKLYYEIEGDDFFEVTNLNQGDAMTTPFLDLDFEYPSAALLNPGQYAGTFKLFVVAIGPDGEPVQLDELEINFEFGVDGANLDVYPGVSTVTHVRGSTPTWTETIDVDTWIDWSMFNGDEANHSVLLVDGLSDQYHYGTGFKQLELSLSEAVNELLPGYYELNLYFYAPSLEFTYPIHLFVVEEAGAKLNKTHLEFFAIKNSVEPEPQVVYCMSETPGIGPLTVFPWFTGVKEDIAANFAKVTIQPIASVNFEPGVYEDVARVFMDGEFYEINVKLTVIGFWDKTYNGLHFTKDNEILELYSQTPVDTYLTDEATINLYDYNHSLTQIKRKWSLAFLNSKCEFNLGRELDGYLNLIKEFKLNLGNKFKLAYRPLAIKQTFKEIGLEDQLIYNWENLLFQYFLRGRKPFGAKLDKVFLAQHVNKISRVTKNSLIQFNFFKPANFAEPVYLKKNGEVHRTYQLFLDAYQGPGFYYKTISLRGMGIKEGDMLTILVGNQSRQFVVFPENKNSLNIGWINQFELMDIFEFTGGVKLPISYESDTQIDFDNWVEALRVIEKTKTQSIVVNTGWILKDDIHWIDELIQSRKAFLYNVNNTISENDENPVETYHIELIPITSKLSGYDSDRGLYSYEVEFQINKKYEDAIYLR